MFSYSYDIRWLSLKIFYSDNSVRIHGRMDDLRFNVLFNSISVISGRCSDDNVCNGTPFTVEKISPRVRVELGPLDQS